MIMLDEIIQEYLDKPLMTERVSSVVYHFTTVGALYNIIKDNRLYLSTALHGVSDDYGDHNKQFFLSLTRQRNGYLGYSYTKDVRIVFNGDKLNANFSGKPMNYWRKQMGKSYYYKDLGKGRVDRYQLSVENEDRIFSNKPYIDNPMVYIERIDILCDDKFGEPYKPYIRQILRNVKQNLVFVYDNKNDFNFQTNNVINSQIENSSYNSPNVTQDFMRYRKASTNIFKILEFVFDCEDIKNKDKKEYAAKVLREYNLEPLIQYVLPHLSNSVFSDDIDTVNVNYELKYLSNTDKEIHSKIAQFFADFLKKHNFKNERDAIQKVKQKRKDKYTKKYYDYDKELSFLVWMSGYRKMVILHPDTTSFWDVVNAATKQYFVDEILNHVYSHKSSSDENFKKYLQHLVKNNISVSQMLNILSKLDIDKDILNGLLNGTFEYKELNYDASWKYSFLSIEERDEFENMYIEE